MASKSYVFSESDNEGVMFNCAVGKIGSKCIAS